MSTVFLTVPTVPYTALGGSSLIHYSGTYLTSWNVKIDLDSNGLIKLKGRPSPPWVQSLRVVLHEVTLFEHDLVGRWGWCGKTWYAVSYRSLQSIKWGSVWSI